MTKNTLQPRPSLSITLLIFILSLFPELAMAADVPKEFHGNWCASSRNLKGDWGAYNSEESKCDSFKIAIGAAGLKALDQSLSCVVRDVRSFDVCPWGMIFKNREQARRNRPGQINPWSPGYHMVFECTGSEKRSEVTVVNWVIEKGSITGGVPPSYRCPWDRK